MCSSSVCLQDGIVASTKPTKTLHVMCSTVHVTYNHMDPHGTSNALSSCLSVCVCLCMCLLLQFVTSVVPVSACLRSLRCSDHINPNVHSRVGLRQTVTKLRCGRNMTCQGLVVYVYHSDHSGYFPSVRSISPFWGSSNRVALSMFPQNWREFLQEEH